MEYPPINQTSENEARDIIDRMLIEAGWVIQSFHEINLSNNTGVAVRAYPIQPDPTTYPDSDTGQADYALFVEKRPVGVIEAKAKKKGFQLSDVEEQSSRYAHGKLKYLDNQPLSFAYESNGELIRFIDYRDPKPRSREVFNFHRPETLHCLAKKEKTLRKRLGEIPSLNETGLRPAQIRAIKNLEESFKESHPRALIQMATGAGKTFTACTFAYRLLKFANAKRILFLVDTRNLGEQAEQEFRSFQPNDDNRKFTELYNVGLLRSSYIPRDHICISTIQRLYSILKGRELDESKEEENPNEASWENYQNAPIPVEYSVRNPIEQFDFIIIDECHRSIYNLWRQVLEYYDAFLIGLTATPDKRTFGFFKENVVSEYSYEESVVDGVNVPYDIFIIETRITKEGARIQAEEYVDVREKLSRKKRWEKLDEDYEYTPNKLDDEVVNPSQIRNIIKTFKEALRTKIFPQRIDKKGNYEVPKTLIFAKTDSHAEDIINIVREEFGEGNEFCKKLTYRASEDPQTILNSFRNDYHPRIAVTVNMVAAGTDVKPLEVLLFMRDVRSSGYFEQMKGRGTRTISLDDLKKVSSTARHTKTHFVIVDAVGVTKSKKTDSRVLERKPSTSLKDLLAAVTVGAHDEDLFTSLANRLIRLEKKLTEDEKNKFIEMAEGKSLNQVAKELLDAYDPDIIDAKTQGLLDEIPKVERTSETQEECIEKAQEQLCALAASTFNGKLNGYIENIHRIHEQVIDNLNLDEVQRSQWDSISTDNAKKLIQDFAAYLQEHKDEIQALGIFYSQPYRRKEVTFPMIKELFAKLKSDKPLLAPHYVWQAYEQLEKVRESSPQSELAALVSLIRRVIGIDESLTAYDKTVDKNFQDWIFKRHSGAGEKFNPEQMDWLRMIKEHIATSFHIETSDLNLTPFNGRGGVGKMQELFGEQVNELLDEMNEVLAA